MSKEVQDAQHAHINYVSALNTLPKIEHLSLLKNIYYNNA
jgi:hypothetical protein